MATERLKIEELTGPQKAAIFFLSMGEDFTAHFFKGLDEEGIKKIGKHMSEISYVPSNILKAVMNEFITDFENDNALVISGRNLLEKVVNKTLDEETAREVFKVVGNNEEGDPFDELSYMPSESLVGVVKGEHPQTIALILSQFPQEKAAEILGQLPDEMKADIAFRVVKMGQVPDDVLVELKDAIKKDISKLGGSSTTKKIDGIEKLANILNDVDRQTEEYVLSHIEQEDESLAEKIRQKMFVFEDLSDVDERGFREILQNVDNQTVAKALKTASDEMKEKVFNNLSERASEMLKEDMEFMGPVRLREVEEAQQGIIKIAKRLEAEGRIVLASKGKEDVLV